MGWEKSCFFYFIILLIALSIPVEVDNASTISSDDAFTITATTSSMDIDPKTVDYKYILRGKQGIITYTVYGGLNEHLSKEPRSITYRYIAPTKIDFINKKLDDRNQGAYLDPLVEEIKNITQSRDDQLRIAVSLVQNLKYDYSAAESSRYQGKYPYETLYTGFGVCSDRSLLLAYLLRGLGYEVAIFEFDEENHAAVGIKCPIQYSYRDTGYCFVESTTPSIISDSSGEYSISPDSQRFTIITDSSGNIIKDGFKDETYRKLTSMPRLLKICDGRSFNSVDEEYYDNKRFYELYTKLKSYPSVLSRSEYNEWKVYHDQWQDLVDKYGIQLVDTYN